MATASDYVAALAQAKSDIALVGLAPEFAAPDVDFAGLAVNVDDFSQYALSAEQFLAHPGESASTLVTNYITSEFVAEVSSAISEAATQACSTAGAVLGTAIPIPGVGTAVGAAAGKVVGLAVQGLVNEATTANHDFYRTPDHRLIPEVETVFRDWCIEGPLTFDLPAPEKSWTDYITISFGNGRSSRVHFDDAYTQVSADFHNEGKSYGGGPGLTVYGWSALNWEGQNIWPCRWPYGILHWAKADRLRGNSRIPGVPVGGNLEFAGDHFMFDVNTAMSVAATRVTAQSRLKAVIVARAIQILNPKLTAGQRAAAQLVSLSPTARSNADTRALTTGALAVSSSAPTCTLDELVRFYTAGGPAPVIHAAPAPARPTSIAVPSSLSPAAKRMLLGGIVSSSPGSK